MPRKKGWYRAKRKAEEEERRQAAGRTDHEYCSLPKKQFNDLLHNLPDHTYHKDEFVQESASYQNFCSVSDSAETEEIDPVIYDDTDVAETVDVSYDHFENMYCELTKSVKEPYAVTNCSDAIKIVEMYERAMKLCVIIRKDFSLQLYVHKKLVSKSNAVFRGITDGQLDIATILKFLNRLKSFHVCVGNTESEFVKLLPTGSELSIAGESKVIGYLEQDFGAKRGGDVYHKSIRSNDCELILCRKGERCNHCSRVRAVLRHRKYVRKEKELNPKKSFLRANHSQMDRTELLMKLNEQKNEIENLEKEVWKLKRQVNNAILKEGVEMDKAQSQEFSELMSACESEVMKAFLCIEG